MTQTRRRAKRQHPSAATGEGQDEAGREETGIKDPSQKTRLPFEIEPHSAPSGNAADAGSRDGRPVGELSAEDLLLNAAGEAAAQGESGRAVSIYRELLDVNPTRCDARAALALLLHSVGRPDDALSELDVCLQGDTDDAHARVARGAILGTMGRFAEAEVDLKRALELDASDPDAYFNLGALMSRKGLWSDALPYLRRSIELEPGRASAYLHLGDALNHVDDLEGALQAYHRSAELGPSNAKAFYGLGVVYDRLNQPDEAAQMYRRSREMAGT